MLKQQNARISTRYGTTSKLTSVPAQIGVPSAVDQVPAGGIVRYVVVLDPGTDIAPGDQLTLVSWGEHTVNPSKAYHVFSADPAGGLGLEVIRCLVGERVQR